MTNAEQLAGKRVLLVEDEVLVAMLTEEILLNLGCIVVGPHNTLETAREAAQFGALDLAVLDLNLAGKSALPVAEVLERRGIPFLLLTGYGESAISPGRRGWRVCGKPFRIADLCAALLDLNAVPATCRGVPP